MDPVSCVSCVSSWYWVNATETHQTFHRASGMRYTLLCQPKWSSNRAKSVALVSSEPFSHPAAVCGPWLGQTSKPLGNTRNDLRPTPSQDDRRNVRRWRASSYYSKARFVEQPVAVDSGGGQPDGRARNGV
jgi:hypothetical protein